MIEFIAKYWLETLFTLVIGALTFCIKHYYSLYKKEQENQKKQLADTIKEELKNYNDSMLRQKEITLSQEDAKLQEAIGQVDSLNTKLLKAVLDVQKKQLKTDCKQLLESNEIITFEQFEDLHDEYEIYKSLGGNGPGSTLFDLVQDKYSSQIMQKDQVELLVEKVVKPMNNKDEKTKQTPQYVVLPNSQYMPYMVAKPPKHLSNNNEPKG